MEILSGEQMRRVDRRAIDGLGIPSLELMEAAGRGVAQALLEDYPDLAARGVLFLCGKGHNGGDGLVAARHLAQSGVAPEVVVLARAAELAPDAAINFGRARDAAGLHLREVADEPAWDALQLPLPGVRVVVDALLGTGIRGGARGLAARAIDWMRQSAAVVVSIDLPSGIDADRTVVEGPAVRAERTYTLCRPKLPLVLGPAAAHAGRWRVIPIGIPDEAVRAEQPELEWLDRIAAGGLRPRRVADSHKGTYGHLLAVAGSRGKGGAAVLVARGALRSGVGLVTVATPASTQPLVAAQQAEVMTEPLLETFGGALAAAGAAAALTLLAGRDALALGPGLGVDPETQAATLAILRGSRAPMVIDADGLNALAAARGRPAAWLAPPSGPAVLTPHPGEAARLLGSTIADVQADRLAAARSLARSTGAVVVLKGHRSLVAAPDGRVAINASGNPGMATAGTGDVLTGVVGAWLARGLEPWHAARLAVFVHGDAGDRAAARRGEDGLIASDVIDELPAALAAVAGASTPGPEK